MIQTKQIQHRFNAQVAIAFPDIAVPKGDSILILGPSGSGKTTLLHILAGLLPPTQGSVWIDQKDIYNQKKSQLDAFRGDHIGIVFQTPHFIQSISAYENIKIIQKLVQKKVDSKAIDYLFERLDISHKKQALPRTMSQGEQQRLSIVRAFINTPKLILADELTSALDDANCQQVISLLKEVSRENQSSLMLVTHDKRLKNEFDVAIELEKLMI